MKIVPHLSREPIGYRYWTSIQSRYGSRQVGIEWLCIMDDFGNLVSLGVSA